MTQLPPGAAISGTTRLYVVLGDPVSQVRVPTLMNPLFARLGIDAVLIPVHAHPEHLATVVRGLRRVGNLDGMFVTVPHKVAVTRLADRCSATVRIAGSANVLRREPDGSWYADNFDGRGFVTGLHDAGHDPAGARVALVGAGGAGSAVAAALLAAGIDQLSIYDPDPQVLHGLLARLDRHWPGRATATGGPRLHDADIAVNATPLGLRPDDPLPFAPNLLPPGSLVADIIMKPRETNLLRTAVARGLSVHYGEHMLDGQVASYVEFFRLADRTGGRLDDYQAEGCEAPGHDT